MNVSYSSRFCDYHVGKIQIIINTIKKKALITTLFSKHFTKFTKLNYTQHCAFECKTIFMFISPFTGILI